MNEPRKPTRSLDARGWSGTWCILQVKSLLGEMGEGDILELVVSDPAVPITLTRILATAGREVEMVAQHDGCFLLQVTNTNTKPGCDPETRTHRRFPMTNLDLSTLNGEQVVDARGSACPGPLLEAKKGIGKVKVGEILEILSNDSGTRNDIPIWAKKVGHEYLGHVEADGYDKLFVRRHK